MCYKMPLRCIYKKGPVFIVRSVRHYKYGSRAPTSFEGVVDGQDELKGFIKGRVANEIFPSEVSCLEESVCHRRVVKGRD